MHDLFMQRVKKEKWKQGRRSWVDNIVGNLGWTIVGVFQFPSS